MYDGHSPCDTYTKCLACSLLPPTLDFDERDDKYFTSNFLSPSVEWYITLYRLLVSFEGHLFTNGRHVMAFTLLLKGIRPLNATLFCVFGILLRVVFLFLYVALSLYDNLCRGCCNLLGERLIDMHDFLTILENSHDHLLVGMNHLISRLVEPGEVLFQISRVSLADIEQTSC